MCGFARVPAMPPYTMMSMVIEKSPTPDLAGVRIAAARLRRGVSPAKMAAALGMDTERYLTQVESGKMRLDISEVAMCATMLSVTTRELLGMPLSPRQALEQRLGAESPLQP